MSKQVNREGFWKSSVDSALPMPRTRSKPWKGQKVFLEKLSEKQAKAHEIAYRGWSTCRVCGQHNGSWEYVLNNWKWPEGFAHYVKQHNVRPSLAFQEFIEDREIR